ncbi:hypothetical protein VB740_07515 [Nostoc sp. UHCC 0251]|nr:hypothetical protein [Nostoc sp. UHCC 0251]
MSKKQQDSSKAISKFRGRTTAAIISSYLHLQLISTQYSMVIE